jgi:aminoglycoside phosphotransferase (APT) family kinase protein
VDSLVFALRLLGQGGWLLRDRLLGGGLGLRDGAPRGAADVDAAWLTRALARGHPGAVVRAVEPRGGHRGTTTRVRLRLEYADEGRGEPPPRHLFLKTTPEPLGVRLFTGLLDLARTEVGFYRHLRPDLPIPAPRVHYARAARHGARFALLLEDLLEAGCRFPGLERRVGLEDARAVVQSLARLHAAFWESPRFAGDLAWLRGGGRDRNAAVERWVSSRATPPVLARHAGRLAPAVRHNVARIHAHRRQLERWWATPPLTLIHGDSHVGNLYFEDGRAGLLDWQVVQRGQGIRDVAYFAINSLEVEDRRSWEDELLDLYRETLAEAGIAGPGTGRDELRERYRGHALYVWISASVTAATPGLQPEAVGRRAVERCNAALEDLRSFQLLDAVAGATGAGAAGRAQKR